MVDSGLGAGLAPGLFFLIVDPLLSSGFTSVTHESYRIFFVLFHIVVVIIIVK